MVTLDLQALADAGFENPKRAQKDFAALATALGEETAQAILEKARAAVDPDAHLAAFDRAKDALVPCHDARSLDWMSRLFEASELFPRVLSSRPGLWRWVLGARSLDREKPAEHYLRECRAALRHLAPSNTEGLYRRLRRYKYRELLRLSVRDVVLGAPLPELGREMAALAQALVAAAGEVIERGLLARYGAPEEPGFCVLGMGKLGGEDLNFSSDIDLVYVYRADGQTRGGEAGVIPTVQLYARLGEALTKALSATTADGFCYRVDLNLRPHGRGGAIVLSLPATLAYYETFGRTWERAALLKARPVAGDATLADELLASLAPFVWRRSLDFGAVDALREMKAQIDLRGKASLTDVKLGPGGIREVEFFANALQLLHGGKNDRLRERHTLKALRKLELAGLIAVRDADALEEAYLFLRRVENRLQMFEERQTQTLPEGDRERRRLARTLGFESWDAFAAELARHRGYVQRAFGTLLGQTVRGEVPDEPMLALALDPDTPWEARAQALAGRGFADPETALAALERLARIQGTPFASGPGGRPGLEAVALLAEVARTADPDQALLQLSDFLGRLHAPEGYLNLLGSAPLARRRLINLFGQSEYLSRYFIGHPELLDAMVQGQVDAPLKTPERLREELAQRAHRYDDPEARLGVLRRYKNEEVLRIGLFDISGEIGVPEVATQLSALADAALDEVLFLAESEQRERYGEPTGGGARAALTIIGLGKLGGRELGYHSDLDLIFVYSGDGQAETSGGSRGTISQHEYFAKVAQRLITFLQLQLREGYLYKIDTRLRPSGNQGALVVSRDAFYTHHAKRAQLWERQALLKARGVAGDPDLFAQLRREVLDPLVYERPLPPGAGAEIDRLRARMERELAQESHEQLNPKTGHGGLVDVEFATQYLQLIHGGARPSVRTANTLEGIAALEASGVLAPADARTLREGYLFHRRVENRLRLVHGHSLSHLPTFGRPLALLARRLGYVGAEPGAAFLADYRARAAEVREAYARLLRRPA